MSKIYAHKRIELGLDQNREISLSQHTTIRSLFCALNTSILNMRLIQSTNT